MSEYYYLLIFMGITTALFAVASVRRARKFGKSAVYSYESGIFRVSSVADGDTIKVNDNGEDVLVRLIGVDTPETVHPNKKVQFFGEEASKAIAKMLSGREVLLKPDPTQDAIDKYQRWLRYVFLPDGTNFNLWLIENGYAYEYMYKKPYVFRDEFVKAEKRAQERKIGLWCPEMYEDFLMDNLAYVLRKSGFGG